MKSFPAPPPKKTPQLRLTPEEGYGEREDGAVITVPAGASLTVFDHL
jgi:FKBP-type peptidyl-prolyl cis-trans isomerase 2